MKGIDILKAHKVIPDIIKSESSFLPTSSSVVTGFSAIFAASSSDKKSKPFQVEPSRVQTLTPTIVDVKPKIEFHQENPSDFFTLIMTDPDAPNANNPTKREWIHYIAIDLQASSTQGHEIIGYIPSAPPKGSGAHRYCFVLFKQLEGKLAGTSLGADLEQKFKMSATQAANRANFNTEKFAQTYKLAPVTAALFNAEWDEHVPAIYARLK